MSKDAANENINEQVKINKSKKPLIAVIIVAVIIIGILIGIILYLLPRPEAKPYNNVVKSLARWKKRQKRLSVLTRCL